MHREPRLIGALGAAGDAGALRQLGLTAYAEGRLAEARGHFEAAQCADPIDPEVLADLAAVLLESGEADRAAKLVARALILEPTHDAGRLTRALADAARGRIDAAIEGLRQLLAAEPPLCQRDAALAALAQSHLAQLSGEAPPPQLLIVDPRSLGLRHRFDVIAKYLYARQRLGTLPGWVNVDVEALYAKHIHIRTGGAEPGDGGRKGSLREFAQQFDRLIQAMAAQGFDPAQPIPLSAEDGLPRNGAHRLAAALAVGCEVAVTFEAGPGGRWDFDWFARSGFAAEELNVLLRSWAEIKGDAASVALLWSPVEAAWAQIEAQIDASLPVVAARTIELPRGAFDELLRDIYSFDWGPQTGPNIERKISLLAAHAPRLRVLFVERPADAAAGLPRQIKTQIRDRWQALAPVDWFTTLHVSESPAETRHLLAIFAAENNLRWLRHRAARPELTAKLAEMVRIVHDGGIDPAAECCVVGSGVLDVLGLRLADDVDFTLRGSLRFRHFDGGVTALAPGIDVVASNYPRSFSSAPAPSDDRLIDDPALHFRVRGIRFADPRIVLERKQHQRRDKDLRDVALLAEFLARAGG